MRPWQGSTGLAIAGFEILGIVVAGLTLAVVASFRLARSIMGGAGRGGTEYGRPSIDLPSMVAASFLIVIFSAVVSRLGGTQSTKPIHIVEGWAIFYLVLTLSPWLLLLLPRWREQVSLKLDECPRRWSKPVGVMLLFMAAAILLPIILERPIQAPNILGPEPFWWFLLCIFGSGLALTDRWPGGFKGARKTAKWRAACVLAWLSRTGATTVIFAGPIAIWHFGIVRDNFRFLCSLWRPLCVCFEVSSNYYFATSENVGHVFW